MYYCLLLFSVFCLTSRHFRRSLQVGQVHHRNSTEPLGTASARADVVAVTGTTVSKHRRKNQLQQNWHNFTKVRRVSYIVSSIMYIWFGCTTTMQATFHILLSLPLRKYELKEPRSRRTLSSVHTSKEQPSNMVIGSVYVQNPDYHLIHYK